MPQELGAVPVVSGLLLDDSPGAFVPGTSRLLLDLLDLLLLVGDGIEGGIGGLLRVNGGQRSGRSRRGYADRVGVLGRSSAAGSWRRRRGRCSSSRRSLGRVEPVGGEIAEAKRHGGRDTNSVERKRDGCMRLGHGQPRHVGAASSCERARSATRGERAA